jgi:ribosomal protein L21E
MVAVAAGGKEKQVIARPEHLRPFKG